MHYICIRELLVFIRTYSLSSVLSHLDLISRVNTCYIYHTYIYSAPATKVEHKWCDSDSLSEVNTEG